MDFLKDKVDGVSGSKTWLKVLIYIAIIVIAYMVLRGIAKTAFLL